MLEFFKKLLGGGAPAARAAETVEYQGYHITPVPTQGPGGWRVEGRIERTVDGEPRTYHFIRADVFIAYDDTVETVLMKARRLIDERGDALFEEPH